MQHLCLTSQYSMIAPNTGRERLLQMIFSHPILSSHKFKSAGGRYDNRCYLRPRLPGSSIRGVWMAQAALTTTNMLAFSAELSNSRRAKATPKIRSRATVHLLFRDTDILAPSCWPADGRSKRADVGHRSSSEGDNSTPGSRYNAGGIVRLLDPKCGGSA